MHQMNVSGMAQNPTTWISDFTMANPALDTLNYMNWHGFEVKWEKFIYTGWIMNILPLQNMQSDKGKEQS